MDKNSGDGSIRSYAPVGLGRYRENESSCPLEERIEVRGDSKSAPSPLFRGGGRGIVSLPSQ